jgi:hypothetical protein
MAAGRVFFRSFGQPECGKSNIICSKKEQDSPARSLGHAGAGRLLGNGPVQAPMIEAKRRRRDSVDRWAGFYLLLATEFDAGKMRGYLIRNVDGGVLIVIVIVGVGVGLRPFGLIPL